MNDLSANLSLRNWFAGKALGGLLALSFPQKGKETTDEELNGLTDLVFRIADAMEARSRQQKKDL